MQFMNITVEKVCHEKILKKWTNALTNSKTIWTITKSTRKTSKDDNEMPVSYEEMVEVLTSR